MNQIEELRASAEETTRIANAIMANPNYTEAGPPEHTIPFSSPRLATAMAQVFGEKAFEIKVEKRPNKDVSRFLSRLRKAHKKASQSSLHLG